MDFVDLRSDTVTSPTAAMRAAMANAEVGDDVFGEDPTVIRLQDMAAERMGKEAGLFVSSGTMGNLAAILTHCGRGDEVIMGNLAHTFLFEGGGIAALGGVHPNTIPNRPDGTLALEDMHAALRDPANPHYPLSRLVVIENTQNRCGGSVLSAEYTQQVAAFAHQHGLLLHIDGARIFNASAALGIEAKELAAPADSITFCLSKGLCAPVGSVLCGSKEFIQRALRVRKQLGGGMRQVGILAAAGIVALQEMTARLVEDHRRARRLAEGLGNLKGLTVENKVPPSNMVFLQIDPSVRFDASQLANRLQSSFVKVNVAGPRRIRLVTHYWVGDQGIDQAINSFNLAFKE